MGVATNINEIIEQYRAFDNPVPYKGLLLYPVKAQDYYRFMSNVGVLGIQKNRTPDVKIIQMSYLQFVFGLILNDIEWRGKFIEIMQLCLNVKIADLSNKKIARGLFWNEMDKDDSLIFHLNGYAIDFIDRNNRLFIKIFNSELSASEFDELIRYIFYQNIYDYFDEFISDDVREVVDKYYAMRNKNINPPTFEEKVISVMSVLGAPKREIAQMSMISIEQLFHSVIRRTDYMIEHNYRAHAMTDKPLPDIEHWAYKSNKERFSEVFVDAQSFSKNASM
jgi:hypothetical protein